MSYNRDNQFNTQGNMGPRTDPMGDFSRTGAQDFEGRTHRDNADAANYTTSGVPAPHGHGHGHGHGHHGHGQTAGATQRDDWGTPQPATTGTYMNTTDPHMGRGPTVGPVGVDAADYNNNNTGTGGAMAAGTAGGTHFPQRDVTDTGIDRHRNTQFDNDPTASGFDRRNQFGTNIGNTNAGMNDPAFASGTGPGHTGVGATGATGMGRYTGAAPGGQTWDENRTGHGGHHPNFDNRHAGVGGAHHAGAMGGTGTTGTAGPAGSLGATGAPGGTGTTGATTGKPSIGDKVIGIMDEMIGKATNNPHIQQRGEARQAGNKNAGFN